LSFCTMTLLAMAVAPAAISSTGGAGLIGSA
jgi:hypothetical protein